MPIVRHALIAASLTAVAVAVPRPAPRRAERLLFTGDILLSREVAVEMHSTGASPFDSVAPLFAQANWVAGNLEGAIGPARDCRGPDTTCFAFPETSAFLLAGAGFKALSIENNHSADLGAAGRVRTRAALEAAGLLALDLEHSPHFVRLGDATMAVVAVSLVRGADGEAESVPSVLLAQKLRLARSLASLVVVSVHWGTELQDWPSAAQRTAAAWLVDHGADLVVGHHPHVVQPPDCVHGHPVFYSLGNHVFDQRYPETKDGLIADCAIEDGRLRCEGVRTHARRGSAVPVVAGEASFPALARCAVRLGAPPVVSGYLLRPEPWTPGDAEDGVAIEGWKSGVFRWKTPRVALVTLQELRAPGGGQLILALERHPSAMDAEIALRPHVYAVGERGLVARWRGTALAWPLIDAEVNERGELCALHRGDSFIRPDPVVTSTRTMLYRWNGFGFSAAADSVESARCARAMQALVTAAQ
jgi:poly-gamma-glutamate synthesis protein (capsule biosynthesis protein)